MYAPLQTSLELFMPCISSHNLSTSGNLLHFVRIGQTSSGKKRPRDVKTLRNHMTVTETPSYHP